MHISELTKKFQQFVGHAFHLTEGTELDGQDNEGGIGHNKPPSSEADEKCPHTRRVLREMTELAHKFNSELIINGAKAKTSAICQVHVDIGDNPLLTSASSITNIEARICNPA